MSPDNSEHSALSKAWNEHPRWNGIRRDYTAAEVMKLRPSIKVEYTLARAGAERLWDLLTSEPYVAALGALTGSQAVQMVKAGLKSIYMSGWQIAADNNLSGQTYPDQSLYPSNSVPNAVKRLNNALMRADQIHAVEGKRDDIYWYAPIVADAEAGFGGPLHAFELMKSMIEAGAGGVHFEDQLASEKKCGHLGGKVLVPTSQFIRTLIGARLAADVLDVPTVIVARTDALSATLLTSDIDPRDKEFIYGDRTAEGYFTVKDGIEPVIARALAYAPYADVLWFETSTPDLKEAEKFAAAVHAEHPGKLLAYNCSPSFNWKKHLDDRTIADFNKTLGKLGYKFQFITLAGWHAINLGAFRLASEFADEGMSAYVRLQEEEFARENEGYTAARHQREVGTGYFDKVLMMISGGAASTTALTGSTEAAQFNNGEAQSEEDNDQGSPIVRMDKSFQSDLHH
jgi:isocitrate lyase